MGRGKAFVDVLDEKLDGYESDAPPARPAPPQRVATCSYVPFAAVMSTVAPAAPVVASGFGRTTHAAPPRPRRTLSMKQLEALDTLIGLGARLDGDFTDDELRRVFRALALHYHPDRHVSSSDAERARMAALFARAYDAYQVLKSVMPKTMH